MAEPVPPPQKILKKLGPHFLAECYAAGIPEIGYTSDGYIVGYDDMVPDKKFKIDVLVQAHNADLPAAPWRQVVEGQQQAYEAEHGLSNNP